MGWISASIGSAFDDSRYLRAALPCFVATAVMVAVVAGAGDSALTKAVKAGDLQAVRALIKTGRRRQRPLGRRLHAAALGRPQLQRRDRARARSPRRPSVDARQRLRRHAAAPGEPHRRRRDGGAAAARRRRSATRASRRRDAADGRGARPAACPPCACCSRAAST